MSTQILTAAASGAKKGLVLKLVVVSGADAGKEVPLEGTVDVGADPSAKLCITDPAVSQRHAVVVFLGGKILLKDVGSRNGTYVGLTRVKEAELALGETITVGKTQILVQTRWHAREVEPSRETRFGEVLGESVAMRELFAILERVAATDVTLLIEGESGTGKELVARSLHAASARRGEPYVVFDCGSVPAELAESELFGHKRGAFSGATADRQGAFQRADGGTLCLDELGELPLDLQPKLLRALENGEVRPVGEDAPRKVNVRIVASTNRDLHAEVQRGRFRQDLLYRLEVVRVRIPPLRARPEDVPALVRHLLRDKLPAGDVVDGPNLKKLVSYTWPGNVRELRNVLTRAVTLGATPRGPGAFAALVFNLGPASDAPATLGTEFPGISPPLPYKDAKAQLVVAFDRAYVAALLERHDDNILRAADAAGISRKHLYELMRRVDGGPEPEE